MSLRHVCCECEQDIADGGTGACGCPPAPHGVDARAVHRLTSETLHIHAAEEPHEEAYIVGNRDALVALRDAIDRAVMSGRPEYARVFTADGEGFAAVVVPMQDMTDMAVPYANAKGVGTGRWVQLSAADWDRLQTVCRRHGCGT